MKSRFTFGMFAGFALAFLFFLFFLFFFPNVFRAQIEQRLPGYPTIAATTNYTYYDTEHVAYRSPGNPAAKYSLPVNYGLDAYYVEPPTQQHRSAANNPQAPAAYQVPNSRAYANYADRPYYLPISPSDPQPEAYYLN